MFGDAPPVIVAVDGETGRRAGLGDWIEQHLHMHAVCVVAQDVDAVERALAAKGLRTGPGLQVRAGSAKDAVNFAAAQGANQVRLWVDADNEDGLPFEARVAALDHRIQLRLESPFSQAS